MRAKPSIAPIGNPDDLSLADYLRLYLRLVGAQGRSRMQYKLSFALGAIRNIAYLAIDLALILILFGRVPSLAGWSVGEVALLFGTVTSSFSLTSIFAAGFEHISPTIVRGGFDRVLTRPLGAFFQVLASELALPRAFRLAQSLVILALAHGYLELAWTPLKLAVLVLTILSGAAIFFSLHVIGAASCFWTIQENEMINVLTHGGELGLSYPLDVFHEWLRRFLTFVLPLAFVNYYPILFLLDRPDPLGLPAWIGLLSPVAALAFVALAGVAWRAGVRHYQGTGT